MLFLTILGHFWCLVVTLVTFSSILNNFEEKKYLNLFGYGDMGKKVLI